MESPQRSLAKSLSWRIIAWSITTVVVWATTGHAEVGIAVGVADSAVKIAAYYVHERAWARVRPARQRVPEG